GTARPVRRYRQGRIRRQRLFRCCCVEQQQHAVAAAVEDVTPLDARDRGQAEHAAIETLRGAEIVDIERRLENCRGFHRQDPIAIFCNSINRAMPLRAKACMAANSSSPKGRPSAVDWISTMPPEPAMTKFASVSAAESSA